MRRTAITVLIALLIATVAEARDRPIRYELHRRKILAYNISLTSFFTLVSAIVQGHVKSTPRAIYTFLIGSAAGAGFNEAKRLAGSGKTTQGWLLANAAASVVENTTGGKHPFGRLGYTVGPMRFRIATPLVRDKRSARIEMDWSVAETIDLGFAIGHSDHLRLRDGLIATDRDNKWPSPNNIFGGFDGATYGVFPGVSPGQAGIWSHEVVHAIQSQQMDSVEPPLCTLHDDNSGPRRLFAFRHIRLGWAQALNLTTYTRRYQRQWNEVEAYADAQKTPVPK